jgi:predicted Zn-dependent protease
VAIIPRRDDMLRRAILVLSAAAVLAGCAVVPITGRRQLSLVPQSDLVQLAAEDYRSFLSETTLSADAGERARVAEVGGRVASAATAFMREHGMTNQLSLYSWEFALVDDPEVANAFCMPGGKIAVYTGLLPLAANDAGLAVVVAHEVAHAIANHGGERMSQLLLTELGGRALAAAVEEKPEQTRQLAMVAYGVGSSVAVLLPYSRRHESEADRIGLVLMARAGYDPREAVPFWQRMSADGGGEPPEFLSTHPSHETRIEGIREHLPEAIAIYESR